VGREPATDQIFGRDLRAAVPRLGTSQPRVKGIRQRHYTGLRLREIDEEDDEGEPAGTGGTRSQPLHTSRARDGEDEGNKDRSGSERVPPVPPALDEPPPVDGVAERFAALLDRLRAAGKGNWADNLAATFRQRPDEVSDLEARARSLLGEPQTQEPSC